MISSPKLVIQYRISMPLALPRLQRHERQKQVRMQFGMRVIDWMGIVRPWSDNRDFSNDLQYFL